MDVEIFNYTHVLLTDYFSGALAKETQAQRLTKKAFKDSENLKTGSSMNAGVSCLLIKHAPPNITFYRDNADFMNNFFV